MQNGKSLMLHCYNVTMLQYYKPPLFNAHLTILLLFWIEFFVQRLRCSNIFCTFALTLLTTHAYEARKYTETPSSSLTIDDEGDGETFIEY